MIIYNGSAMVSHYVGLYFMLLIHTSDECLSQTMFVLHGSLPTMNEAKLWYKKRISPPHKYV